jgi:hypothetical protein
VFVQTRVTAYVIMQLLVSYVRSIKMMFGKEQAGTAMSITGVGGPSRIVFL